MNPPRLAMAGPSDSSTTDLEMGPAHQPPPTTDSDGEKPDANIVDWDGPSDSQNPRNWPSVDKNAHIVLVSLVTLNA